LERMLPKMLMRVLRQMLITENLRQQLCRRRTL
jgi:hypothetical protein